MWWLFMNRGTGSTIFNTLFWLFPALATGTIFVDELNTAVCGVLLTKQPRRRYFLSKTLSVFVVTFLSMLCLFLLNLALVYLVCPMNMEVSDFLIPKEGNFAAWLYAKSLLTWAVTYNVMGAFAQALLAVLYQEMHMILRLKNRFFALIFPPLFMYALEYIVEIGHMWKWSLRILLQPVAASATTFDLSGKSFIVVFGALLLADVAGFFIAIRRNRDIL